MPTTPVISRPLASMDDLRAVQAAAAPYRPEEWVRKLDELRLQYEGEVAMFAKREIMRRYPETGSRMPVVAFPWVETVAAAGSTIYDTPTRRELIGQDGKDLPAEDQAAIDFANLLEEIGAGALMPEADRIRFLARGVVLHPRSDSIAGMARGIDPPTKLEVIWPQDLIVIPHPRAPTDLQACLRLLWKTGDAQGHGVASYVDWRRDYVVDENGNVGLLGTWKADFVVVKRNERTTVLGRHVVDESLVVTPIWDPYPLKRLPFFVAHRGIPSGGPFMRHPSTIKDTANLINSSLSSEQHVVDYNAAPMTSFKSDRTIPSNVAIGPGVLFRLRPNEDLESITQTADLAGIRATNAAHLEALALTQRQRPGSFTGVGGAESGVALKVRSVPAEKARREDKEQMRPFEERELWPGVVEVHDYFRGTSIAARTKRYRVDYPDPPDFETKAERQTRLIEARDARLITSERAAVEAEYYEDDNQAEEAITAIEADHRAAMSTALTVDRSTGEGGPDDDVDDDA